MYVRFSADPALETAASGLALPAEQPQLAAIEAMEEAGRMGARIVCLPETAPQVRMPNSRRSAERAAKTPDMPWTPPPGGVDDEHR